MSTRALSPQSGATPWTGSAPEPEALPAALAVERRRLSFVDAAVLGLIGLVVVLVSLPRLRRFAVHENEIDAMRMLRVLGEATAAHPESLGQGGLAVLLASSSTLRARLEDVEVLEDGRLRRHGYVFANPAGSSAIVAWPWDHGRTGLAAFAIEPGGELIGTPNEAGRFSGPDDPPPAPGFRSDRAEAVDPLWAPVPRR